MSGKLDTDALLAKNPKAAAVFRENRKKLEKIPVAVGPKEYGLGLPYGSSRLLPADENEGTAADAVPLYAAR